MTAPTRTYSATRREIAGLIWDYYRLPGFGVGGNLHIVTDDLNIETEHITWCRERAVDAHDDLGVRICDLLLERGPTVRKRIIRDADPYGDVRP